MYKTIADDQAARLDSYWNERVGIGSGAEQMAMREFETLRTQYRVSDFITWQRDGGLQLNPNFQRRSVWRKGAKSYLIDTILRGLPVPIIFVRDIPADVKTLKAKRDVVDGQQRIRTILSFVSPGLLPDYDQKRDAFKISRTHNKELGGKTFDDLPMDYRQRILDYQFSVHSFGADTDDRDILQIFARMNATGYKLNAQELRNAEFFGEFKTSAFKLAAEQLNRWRSWNIFTPEKIARMNEVELASEFMLLIMRGVLNKENQTISMFYKRFDKRFPEKREVSTRFRKVFDAIANSFGDAVVAELFGGRTMFYALFATMYGLMYGIRTTNVEENAEPIKSRKLKKVTASAIAHIKESGAGIKAGKAPLRVQKSVRGATTDASTRTTLINFLAGEGNDPWLAKQS